MIKNQIKSKVISYKKELILQEAGKYIEEVGYNSLKINDLAKKCSISVGQLYQLFESKDKMFYEYVLYQINNFYNTLIENCKNTNFAQEKLLIFTKLKLKIFQEKRKAILDPISGDPLFFVKFNNKNPSLIIQEFLSLQFKDLEDSYNIKIKNPLQLAYAYNAYTLGYIEYCLNNNIDDECDDKLAKVILDTFLHGMLK